MIVYNAGITCSEGIMNAPLRQMKWIWEQTILMGLGRDRKVNAKRLLFIYDNGVCVYPAQNLDLYTGNVATGDEDDFYSRLQNGVQFVV